MAEIFAGRRSFLEFMGRNLSAGLLAPSILGAPFLTGCQSKASSKGAFAGLAPTTEDAFVLLDGLSYNPIAKMGRKINQSGDTFGSHCDFNTFFPMPNDRNQGLLWTNHESLTPEILHGKDTKELTRSKAEIEREQYNVGGSILHIRKQINGEWQMDENSKYNRRISGLTRIPFSHGKKILGADHAIGTIANCAGGQTPWGTVLTSEENYHIFYGDREYVKGRTRFIESENFRWYTHSPFPPEHYGWIVEINPWTGKATKQVMLGRAAHEGATVAITKNKQAVVYMGEDRVGGFIFKFVSNGLNLDKGVLYAADTTQGKWLALDYEKSKPLQAEFKNQLEVLIYSHRAAEVVGATPQDRPEDIEIDPHTGNIIIALTNNQENGNPYGGLLKITEEGDYNSEKFHASTWLAGGPVAGFACPDNLAFDNHGNLWVTTDMSEKMIGKDPYKEFGNNGLFYLPLTGPGAGVAVQVASAPVDAELTGPWFSPDYKTLFLSVQHPGIGTRHGSIARPTSRWPDGPGTLPKSTVVALHGPLLNRLTS